MTREMRMAGDEAAAAARAFRVTIGASGCWVAAVSTWSVRMEGRIK
jgi:hypothetical protein